MFFFGAGDVAGPPEQRLHFAECGGGGIRCGVQPSPEAAVLPLERVRIARNVRVELRGNLKFLREASGALAAARSQRTLMGMGAQVFSLGQKRMVFTMDERETPPGEFTLLDCWYMDQFARNVCAARGCPCGSGGPAQVFPSGTLEVAGGDTRTPSAQVEQPATSTAAPRSSAAPSEASSTAGAASQKVVSRGGPRLSISPASSRKIPMPARNAS
jgi:hypothetical protein